MKTLKLILLITLPAIIVVLIILEVFFRIGIPASNPPNSFFDEKEKMYFFSNEKETGLFTIGRFAEIRARWRINNMHWNYPIDYFPQDEKKMIAVIGDSYIEAFQVNVGESYPFLLREKLKSNYEVYGFGVSGAPLSQYLHISRYVNKHFNPEILIFNVVQNDFDESVQELDSSKSYFLQVSSKKGDSITETTPQPYSSSTQYQPWKKVVYKSAFLRYLYFNLKLYVMVDSFRDNFLKETKHAYEANINVEDVKNNEELIFKSTNYVVEAIKKENMDKRIIFVIDAPRKAIYKNALDESKVLWIHEMLKKICANNNVEFIDLTSFMMQDYRRNKTKFNTDLDGHWNEYGHEFVANVLYESIVD